MFASLFKQLSFASQLGSELIGMGLEIINMKNPFNAASIQGNPKDIIRPQLTPAGSVYQNIFFKKHLRPVSWIKLKKNGKNKE